MSVASIFSSGLLSALGQGTGSNKAASSTSTTQFRLQLQQLGKDIQSGDLPTAKSDLATLQQTVAAQENAMIPSAVTHTHNNIRRGGTTPGATSDLATNPTGSVNADALLLQQLSQGLQGGNISAAQAAYNNLKMGSLVSSL